MVAIDVPVPPDVVTETVSEVQQRALTTKVSDVALSTEKVATDAEPIFTEVAAVKSVPVTLTVAP
jgi:hypothetical protein